MFSSSAALVGFGFSLLAASLAPQAAARFASIQFSSVTQCGSFSINFEGGKAPDALPLTLSVIPINGTPVFIPLPDNAWNATAETGAAITFLPFPEGTEFVASLDDADGVGTALVSDVLVVEASSTNDTSCLPSVPTPFVPQYAVSGALKQCESFTVDFNASIEPGTPTLRAFVPTGASFDINQTDASSTTGSANYLMDVPRDSTVVLLFSDSSNGYHETSGILPVSGDVSSDTSCIPTDPLTTAASLDSSDTADGTHVAPKITFIVIGVCAGVVILVAAAMILWYFLYRRRAKRARKFSKLEEAQSPTGRSEKPLILPQRLSAGMSPTSPASVNMDGTQQYAINPPYIRMGSALITPTSPDPKDPFGEQAMGPILGSLSARESLNSSRLGATALGNNPNGSSVLALPHVRSDSLSSPAVRSSGMRGASSVFDPTTDAQRSSAPYWTARVAVTPDNSLASRGSSILRRVPSRTQSISSASVSSVEIDRILEMATIYGGSDIPELPQPVVTAPATLRSSAYMAGRESRRASFAPSSPSSSPTHSRNNSATVSSNLSHSASHPTLRLQHAFRKPPLTPLPSSPLASPGLRPSLDIDRGAPSLTVPAPAQQQQQASMLSRSISSATRGSVYSDGDGLEDFVILQPPRRS